jgi:drug/metabolite transporter (DMT)-like permease
VPSHALVWLAVIFLTTVWAVNFIAAKIALRYFPAMTLASIRVVLAGSFILLLNPLCRRLPAFQHASDAPRQKHTPLDLWRFLYLGFLGVTVNQICFTIGLRYTSVKHSAIIVGMGPIYALVLAVLFRLESATLRKVFGMTVSLLGVIVLAAAKDSTQHSPAVLGDFITFIGSLGFAFYAVLGKRVAPRYDALTMTTYNFLFGALFVLPLAIHRAIASGPPTNWLASPWPAWAALIYRALFSSTLAYLFYFWLLRYLEVTQLAAYNYLLPVSASVLCSSGNVTPPATPRWRPCPRWRLLCRIHASCLVLVRGCCKTPILQIRSVEPVISRRKVIRWLLCAAGFDRQLAKAPGIAVAHGSPDRVDPYCPQSTHCRGQKTREVHRDPDRIPCF